MIDVHLLRDKPDAFYESARKRFMDTNALDRFFELDEKWRKNLKEINDLKREKNEMSLKISETVKKKGDPSEIKKNVRELNEKIDRLEAEQKQIASDRDAVLKTIPNIIHESVPVCKGDENNTVVRYVGKARVFSEDLEYFRNSTPENSKFVEIEKRPISHVDLLEKLNLIDIPRAGKVAGARFYYLKNRLVKT